MSWSFFTLMFLGMFSADLASAKTKEQVRSELNACTHANCTVEILLHLIRDDIFDLRVDQQLMKQDLVNHLELIEDVLSGKLPGMEPARIEHILANHYRDFRPSGNLTDANLPMVHTSCEAAYNAGWTRSGVYRVSPEGTTVVMDVFCEQELFGGGWTVFQRRMNGKVDFYHTWDQYKKGFGDLNGEFWLGNDNIHALTADRHQMLKVELEYYGDGFAYANYGVFWVNNEASKYKIHVSDFSAGEPNPGDSLTYHNDCDFTTYDVDNDADTVGNCAKLHRGAWWYKLCHHSNLNGIYGNNDFGNGTNWSTWKGHHTSMTGVRMMVKANPSLLADDAGNLN